MAAIKDEYWKDEETGYMVAKHKMIGFESYTFSVYTPTTYEGKFHTFFRIPGGELHGRVGTEEAPESIRSIPHFDERNAKCLEFRSSRYQVAYDAITRVFPEASKGHRSLGHIRLW